jgi:hypothetical protein
VRQQQQQQQQPQQQQQEEQQASSFALQDKVVPLGEQCPQSTN